MYELLTKLYSVCSGKSKIFLYQPEYSMQILNEMEENGYIERIISKIERMYLLTPKAIKHYTSLNNE